MLLGILACTYAALFSYWSVRNYYGFGTAGFDLGIFDQGTWLLSRFKEPFVTVRGLNLFGDHTSFILLFLVPFYWFFDTPAVLLVAQTTAIGVAAVPVFLIGKEKLKSEWLALLMATAYLAHPAVHWTNYENFHPDSFEIPLLFFALFFMIKSRWRPFLVCAGLLLLVKEDVALMTFALGVYVALFHNRRIGVITAGASVAWLLVITQVVLPALNGTGTLYGSRLPFGGLGGTIKAFVTRPGSLAAHIVSEERPWYLLQLFLPVAFVSLGSPLVMLIAAGPLMLNLLSDFPYQQSIHYHYSTLIIPVIVFAAITAIAKLQEPRLRTGAASLVTAAALVTGYVWGPSKLSMNPYPISDPSSNQTAQALDAVARIPDDASVSAHYVLVTHLSHREEIYEFPNPFKSRNWGDGRNNGERLPEAETVEYVIVPDGLSPEDDAVLGREVRRDFETIYLNELYEVLRRAPE